MGTSSSQEDSNASFTGVDKFYSDAKVVGTNMCLHNARVEVRKDQHDKLIRINNYKVIRLLGEGRYGEVYLCRSVRKHRLLCCYELADSDENDDFAIKLVRRSEERKQEFNILKSVQHNNIVSLVEYIDDDSHPFVYLVFESLGGGPIAHCTDDGYLGKATQPWSEEKAAPLFLQMIRALEYLHGRGVFHRDIKPENVVFTSPCETEVKLIDFGASRMLRAKGLGDDSSRVTKGTPFFMACEMLSGKRFSEGLADVWALGVLFFLLCVGHVPFGKGTSRLVDLCQSIQEDQLTFPPAMSLGLQEMIRKMLERDISKRASLPYLLRHQWINQCSGEADRPALCNPLVAPSSTSGVRKRSPGFNIRGMEESQPSYNPKSPSDSVCITPLESSHGREFESRLGCLLDDKCGKQLLIVEDIGKVRAHLRWMLEQAKLSSVELELLEMQFVEDALDLILSRSREGIPFDLVIMDVYPRNNGTTLTGVDAVTHLRNVEFDEDLEPTPVWFSYAEAEPFVGLEDRAEDLRAGTIMKPFSPGQARAILEYMGVRSRDVPEEALSEMCQSNHYADKQLMDNATTRGACSLVSFLDGSNTINVPDDYTTTSQDTPPLDGSFSLRSSMTHSKASASRLVLSSSLDTCDLARGVRG